MFACALLLLASNPPEDILTDWVDEVEYNIFYRDNEGRLSISYVQMVFWRDEHVVAWRRVDAPWPRIAHGQLYIPHPGYGQFNVQLDHVLFHDNHKLRRIYFKRFYESCIDYDSEVRDRLHLRQELRPGLRRVPCKQ